MPAKKRTSQSKHTPPTSPTASTSHGTLDQHHHLRHAGPSISTRASAGSSSSKPPPLPARPERTAESVPTDESIPETSFSRDVPPPNARTTLTKFLYVLAFLGLPLLGWYLYGMVALMTTLKEEVGWWGIIVPGDSLGGITRWEGTGVDVDRVDRLECALNALADVLGITPVEVASAVKPLVPDASLTSVAWKAAETGTSEAVRVLFEDTARQSGPRTGATVAVAEFEHKLREDETVA